MAPQKHVMWSRVSVQVLIFLFNCCLATTTTTVGGGQGTRLTSSVSTPPVSESALATSPKEPTLEPETTSSPAPTSDHVNMTNSSSSSSSYSLPRPCIAKKRKYEAVDVEAGSNLVDLYVVGLFGINGSYPTGRAFQVAASLAVEDINKRPDVLPGYRIILEPVNTQCKPSEGMDGLYRKLYTENTTKIMVLGSTCSEVTEQTSTAAYKYNMVQISYSALSPRLSEVDLFPWFFRVMASETELSLVRVLLLKHFNWSTVTIVQASEHLFSSTVEKMTKKLDEYDIKLNDTIPFEREPKMAVEKLANHDARIIYFASYEKNARNACCEAYRRNFTGPGIVWIFPGFYDLKWYEANDTLCTVDEILKVIDGYFTVINVNLAEDGSTDDNVGTNQTDYKRRFRDKAKAFSGLDQHNDTDSDDDDKFLLAGEGRAPLAYDAMWAIAMALNCTLTDYLDAGHGPDVLKEFSYTNICMGKRIFRNMKNLSFRGLSGNVSFTPKGDRIPQIAVQQFRVNHSTRTAKMVTIGLYSDKNMTWNDDVFWRGGYVPVSNRRTERVAKPLSWSLYLVTSFLAAAGVLLSVAFLVFNVRHRHVRLIKMSSPNINNLILVGCMLVYPSVILHNVKGLKIEFFCHARLYLMVLGFSLGYGSLFAKIWRVYEIMTASRKLAIVTKDLRDSRLLMTVGILVAVNLGLLILWTALDPLTLTAVDIEDSAHWRNSDVREIQQTLECQSHYQVQFTMGLLALQALLILFGAFLAFQTREMSIPELNDSRWVGLCIYNVVVLGSLGVILVLGTRQSPHVAYLLESVIILVGTTLTQCLVFVPKLLAYRRVKQNRKNGNQLSSFNVKVMCLAGTASSSSNSIRSNVSANQDACSPGTATGAAAAAAAAAAAVARKHQDEEGPSAPPSPTKALKIAGQSLSAALKRCCSSELMQQYTKDHHHERQQQVQADVPPPPSAPPPPPVFSGEILSAGTLLFSYADVGGEEIAKRAGSVEGTRSCGPESVDGDCCGSCRLDLDHPDAAQNNASNAY